MILTRQTEILHTFLSEVGRWACPWVTQLSLAAMTTFQGHPPVEYSGQQLAVTVVL